MSECDLSIVIPVFNDQENLTRILGELVANPADTGWEVIVIDDGSPEPLMLTESSLEHWQIHRREDRRGAASARNAGVKQARGEHLVLLSAFLKIPGDYIARIRAFVRDHQFDIAQHLMERQPSLKANHFQDFLVDQSGRTALSGGVLPVKNTQFTATVLKREIFSEVGGFDENMNHYGGHELDLAYRLDQQGYSQRVIMDDFPLERVKIENHGSIKVRLQEYGHVGLPALLQKHPELKREILTRQVLWGIASVLGIPRMLENRIARKIEMDRKLARHTYRLYLHLIVRNAWDVR